MIEYITNILSYKEREPLLFTNVSFWVFFAVVLTVFSFIYPKKSLRNGFLFLASLFFYYKTSGFFFTILLVSTLSDFLLGKQIFKSKNPLGKKLWLTLSIVINLFILVYFKYAYFFTDAFNELLGTEVVPMNHFAYWSNSFFGSHFRVDKILLPVGVSFFTFQTISYSVDIYRGLIKPVKSLLDFGFFVSFFPQLVAGPIVRASDFIPQLYKDYKLSKQAFGSALFLILNGLLKKMFLADYIAVNFIDRIFANPLSYTGTENLLALYGYSLQVYADFSGYTDIAIGLALLLGFQLPTNFNSPYKASSVAGFWKRWHISLSSWLKDYLYIPMGGNRSGSTFSYVSMAIIVFFVSLIAANWWVPIGCIGTGFILVGFGKVYSPFKNWLNTNINLMMTMLIGGLWHGASWNFVVWGGLNGLGLVVYKLWQKVSPWGDKTKWYNRFIGIFITFNFITFTRTWFRSDSFQTASNVLNQITTHLDLHRLPEILWGYKNVFIVMLIGYIIHWLPTNIKTWYKVAFIQTHFSVKVIACFIVSFFIYQVLTTELQPFIYFAF